MLNLRVAILSAALTLIAIVVLTIAYASTTTAQTRDQIAISDLDSPIVEDNSDSFTVTASGLPTHRSYRIDVGVGSNLSIGSACSAASRSVSFEFDTEAVSANSFTSMTKNYTVYGCSAPGGTVTANLVDITGDEDDPLYFPIVNTDSQYVRVVRTVKYGSSSYSVDEGSSVSVAVSLSHSDSKTFPITDTLGSAESTDYSVPSSVTTSSSKSGTISLTANHDSDCDDETVTLGFDTLPTNWISATPSTTTITITDDDKCVMFGSSAYSVNEGSSKSVTVRLSETTSANLEIPIAVTGGSAEGGDYSGVPSSVTVSRGAKSTTFSLSANQDSDCDDETVRLGFGTPSVRLDLRFTIHLHGHNR